MKTNKELLEKRISDYQTIIKNPRNWKLFRNFVIVQKDLKEKQAQLMSKRITVPTVKNIENKLCFIMYLIFEFPEITEKIRQSIRLQKHIITIAQEIPLVNNQNQYDEHKNIIMNELSELFDLTDNSWRDSINEKNSSGIQQNRFNLIPEKESFHLFMERFHMDIPEGTEWEFLLSNNILTTSNILLIQQAYNRGESNIEKTYISLGKNWNNFFQSLEEYIKYVLENQLYPYVFTSIFIESAHQFKDENNLLREYQEGLLISLSRLIQNDNFLNPFVDQIIHKMYMVSDLGQFARHNTKIFELKQFRVKNNTNFVDMFNYIIKRNWRIMQTNEEDNKLHSLLISTCRYNNSLLKTFYIHDSIGGYIDNQKIQKAMWKIGPVAQFADEDQKNIAVFTARIVELKYWLSVLKEKEVDYKYKDHLDKLKNEKSLLNFYELPYRTTDDYVYIKKHIIGNLIQKSLQTLRGQKNIIHSYPIMEALESLALMIFYKENQEAENKLGENDNLNFALSMLSFPRVVIKLIQGKEGLLPKDEYFEKTTDLVFLNKKKDVHLKELINIQNKLKKIKIRKKTKQDTKEIILKACKYLFESVEIQENKKETHFAIGEIKRTKTKIFLEKINNKISIKGFTRKYDKIFKNNKDKFQILIILVGDDSRREYADKVTSIKRIGTGRVIFLNIEELT